MTKGMRLKSRRIGSLCAAHEKAITRSCKNATFVHARHEIGNVRLLTYG